MKRVSVHSGKKRLKYGWLRSYKIPLQMEKPDRFYSFCERLVFFTPGFEYKTDPLGVVDKITVFSSDIDTPEWMLKRSMKRIITICLVAYLFLVTGCTPRVAVEAPSEPITINLNVKIDHEVRVKVEKDLDQLINKESDLF